MTCTCYDCCFPKCLIAPVVQYQDAPTSELETPPWDPDSEDATPYSSFIHFMSKNPNELLKEAAEEDSDETRKQDILKALVRHQSFINSPSPKKLMHITQLFKRDGPKCPLTGASFDPRDPNGCTPYLTQIISNAVHDKVSHPSFFFPLKLFD